MKDAWNKSSFLASQPCLEGLPAAGLEELSRALSWSIVKSGEVVIKEGEASQMFFWLHTGHLEVTCEGRVIGWVSPGETVGEIGLLGDRPPTASLRATQDSLILGADHASIRQVMEKAPLFTTSMARLAVERLTSGHKTGKRCTAVRIAVLSIVDDQQLCRDLVERLSAVIPDCCVIDADRVRQVCDFPIEQPWTPAQTQQMVVALSGLEGDHNAVLYVANPEPDEWSALCVRQSSHRLVLAQKYDDPSLRPVERDVWSTSNAIDVNSPELLLLAGGPGDETRVQSMVDWLQPRPKAHFSVYDGSDEEVLASLARRLVAPPLRLTQLAQLPLFHGMDADELAILATSFDVQVIRAGETLCTEGAQADSLFVIEAGRFLVHRGGENIGELGTGDVAGEMGLVRTETKRTATLRAKRDSIVLTLSRARFDELSQLLPQMQHNLARIMVDRISDQSRSANLAALTIALVPITADPAHADAFQDFVQQLEAAFRTMGTVEAISSATLDQTFRAPLSKLDDEDFATVLSAEWLNHREQLHDFLLLVGDPQAGHWNRRIILQADQVLHVGMGSQSPEPGAVEQQSSALHERRSDQPDLVLLHPADARSGHNTLAWLDARDVRRHYHARAQHRGDAGRVARFLTNSAIGLVLTGVSSRVICHVGVLKSLQERGIPIDLMVGVSSGAGAAALASMGLSWQEIRDTVRKISDDAVPRASYYTLPYVSLMHGTHMERSIAQAYGEACFEDQFIPCKVLAVDLRSSELLTIDKGALGIGVRASGSLPVLLPPVCHDGRVLVDGGMLNNSPVEYLGEVVKNGWTLVSDPNPVSQPFGKVTNHGTSLSGWKVLWDRLLGRDLGAYPTLGEVIIQSMCVESFRQQAVAERMKEAPNTIFFDTGVESQGYFSFLAPDEQIELMHTIAAATAETLDASDAFVRAVQRLHGDSPDAP